MEEDRKRDDPMDLDKPEDAPPAYTALGSPSGLTDWTEKEDKVKTDHDEAEEEEEEEDEDEEKTKEEKGARRKAKGKAKASPPPPDDNDDDNNNNKDQPPRVARPTPNPSPPTAALNSDTHTDMDTYRALETHKALETAHGRGTHFADADAAMNDTLSSVPLSPNTENTAPGPCNGPTGSFDSAKLRGKLETLRQRQQQQRGDGGRGQGEGWGFAWQETMTREKVEKEGWGGDDDDDAFPSQSAQAEREEAGWEVYDEAAWETAAGRAAKQERRVVALKVPRSSFSVRGESETAGRRGELVRAVRGYEAILSGTFLSYERDDVMRVVHRDGDGRCICCEWVTLSQVVLTV